MDPWGTLEKLLWIMVYYRGERKFNFHIEWPWDGLSISKVTFYTLHLTRHWFDCKCSSGRSFGTSSLENSRRWLTSKRAVHGFLLISFTTLIFQFVPSMDSIDLINECECIADYLDTTKREPKLSVANRHFIKESRCSFIYSFISCIAEEWPGLLVCRSSQPLVH